MEQFVVSARKYRPSTFQSVVGQAHITETLKNAIERGHLAHAYLFTGPRGVGKTTCARIFAKAINCMNPGPDHEACGECESCLAFDQGRSFSIHELDAASNNSVEDIRALTEKVRIPPQVGKYSVYIIDEVHMLSAAAFNAFLKTLEEPPHYAVFILATTEKHKIIPTILSRCQCYDFNRIRVEDMVRYLQYIADKEEVTYDDESLHIIAQRADGGMRDALSMFDRVVSFCGNTLTGEQVAASLNVLDYNTYFEATELMLHGEYAGLLNQFDGILRRGFEGQLFIAGLNGHMRDLLVCKNPQTTVLLEVTGQVAERYREQAKSCEVDFLFHAINLLTQTDSGYRQATNRRLHTELALMKLCGLKKKADTVDIEEDTYPVPPISVATTSEPVQTPIAAPEPVNEPAIQTVTSEPASAPEPVAPKKRGSLTGISIHPPKTTPKNTTPATADVAEPVEVAGELTDQEFERQLTQHYPELIAVLQQRGRPRLATALTNRTIEGKTITVTVPTEVAADELNQAKWEIEQELMKLLEGRRGASLTVVVDANLKQVYRPVTLEDKLQFLVDKNPNLLLLRDELDMMV